MRRFFLAIACLAPVAASAQEMLFQPPYTVFDDSEFEWAQPFRDRNPWPPAGSAARMTIFRGEDFYDAFEGEITRLESLFDEGTPPASGRYGEVTARFGPRWSPYFQSQIRGLRQRGGKVPPPDSPEAHANLVESAGRTLRQHKALIAEQLLALYKMRAIRRLAEQGVPPDIVDAELARNEQRLAARLGLDSMPHMDGSIVKVATYRNSVGYFLPQDGGGRVLDIRAFTPDAPRNAVLMLSLRATLQRQDDSPATVAVALEIEVPYGESGRPETVAGPTLYLLGNDPDTVRKQASIPCTQGGGLWHGELDNRPRYMLRISTPEGATGGDVQISHVLVKVHYITGGFIEAGTIE